MHKSCISFPSNFLSFFIVLWTNVFFGILSITLTGYDRTVMRALENSEKRNNIVGGSGRSSSSASKKGQPSPRKGGSEALAASVHELYSANQRLIERVTRASQWCQQCVTGKLRIWKFALLKSIENKNKRQLFICWHVNVHGHTIINNICTRTESEK